MSRAAGRRAGAERGGQPATDGARQRAAAGPKGPAPATADDGDGHPRRRRGAPLAQGIEVVPGAGGLGAPPGGRERFSASGPADRTSPAPSEVREHSCGRSPAGKRNRQRIRAGFALSSAIPSAGPYAIFNGVTILLYLAAMFRKASESDISTPLIPVLRPGSRPGHKVYHASRQPERPRGRAATPPGLATRPPSVAGDGRLSKARDPARQRRRRRS